MKLTHLKQGSPEWLAHRRTMRNASDASVMMGALPSMSRRELVRLRAVGLEREHSDYVQRFVLDRGHEVEPALRAIAERMLGEDLYPVVAVSDDGYLAASFDGVTLAEDVIFEAKQSSSEKRASIDAGEVPASDYWQVVQQFAVCESAERCLYLVGDGTEAGTACLTIHRSDIEHDIPTLRAGWEQFDRDVADYQPEPAAAPAPVGRTPDQLPALRVEVTGMVTASNLAEWKGAAIAVFQGIRTDLQTDQDFADAERTVKWCGDIEDQLKAAKAHALSQTASIDELFRTIDAISAEARAKRLELDKLVKHRKDQLRVEIVSGGVAAVREHYATINAALGEHAMVMPGSVATDIGAAIKGKKSFSSMRDAVDASVANAKVAGSTQALRVTANMRILAEYPDHASLFADRVQLCAMKQPEDLRNLVAARIAEHDKREADRLERERERIRQEEADRIERERAEQNTPRAVETEQPPTAAGGGMAGSTGALRAAGEPGIGIAETARPSARIKLGDINGWIAPLSITADGLATLGFKPVGTDRAAKLYAANDLPRICQAMAQVIAQAPVRATQKEAA